MDDAILFVAGAPAPAHAAWRDGFVALDQAALQARLGGAANADEPQVVIFAPTLAHPLQLARSVRAAWHLCELVFVADAAHYDQLRGQLGRAPMIGPHWSALREGDPAFDQVVAEAARNARRRARLRTTLERANVRIAAPRPIEEATYRRLQLADHFMGNVLAQTKDGIVGLDPGLRVIQWNDSAARQWGVPQGAALGLGMDIAVSAVRDDGGHLIGVSLVIRDATDRHARLEQERALGAEIARSLEEKRRQLADMFDLAPGFMSVTRGPAHVFEMANRAYAALFGERTLAPVAVRAAFPELQGQPFVALRDPDGCGLRRQGGADFAARTRRPPGRALP